MSEERADGRTTESQCSIDDIARLRGVVPMSSIKELGADIWESDEELDAFVSDMRRSRNASLA